MIAEFTDSLRNKHSHLLREKAYKAIGQLFVEIESKYLGSSSDTGAEDYYLNFLETPKEEILKKLNQIQNKLKPKGKVEQPESESSEPLLASDEFIGQDEHVFTQTSSFQNDLIVEPSIEYTSEDLGCKFSLSLNLQSI